MRVEGGRANFVFWARTWDLVGGVAVGVPVHRRRLPLRVFGRDALGGGSL